MESRREIGRGLGERAPVTTAVAAPDGSDVAAEIDEAPLLRRRARLAVVFTVVGALAFAAIDPWIASDRLWHLWSLKAALLGSCLIAWKLTSEASSTRATANGIIALGVAIVLVSAVSSLIEGENWHATTLASIVALTAAAVMPWGLREQAKLAIGAFVVAMIPVVLRSEGPWTAFLIVCLVPLALSVPLARRQERDRRAMEQTVAALRENVRRLRQLTEHVDGVFWLNEPSGELLYVSPRFDEMWGRSRSDLENRPQAWLDSVHPEDRPMAARGVALFSQGRPSTSVYRLLRPDGGVRWIRDAISPITGSDGRMWRIARMSLDITPEKEAAAAERMRELARSIQRVVEDERRRIARELHDELGQALTGVKLLLSGVAERPGEGAGERIRACVREIDASMRAVRAMIHELRPPALDELGLVAALRAQADAFAAKTGIPCEVAMPEREPTLTDEEVTTVFRIAQESLTNVARHAAATQVAMRFEVGGDCLRLSVEDDGRGIDTGREDFGLRGMRERATLLNGILDIDTGRAGGTVVQLRLPRLSAPRHDV